MPKFRLRSPLWRVPVKEEVREELEFHLEMRTRQYQEEGMDEAAARERARASLGDPERLGERCEKIARQRNRRFRLADFVSDLLTDSRFALRQLQRQPGVAAAVILTLGLGIGAVTAVFSIVQAVLLDPLPLPNSDRLVMLGVRAPGAASRTEVISPREFGAWRSSPAFAGMATILPNGFTMLAGELPQRVQGIKVSEEFFVVTGAPILRGRSFDSRDFQPGSEKVVILGQSLWRQSFGGVTAALGRSISLDGVAHQVVGVLGPELEALYPDLEVLTPQMWTAQALEAHASYLMGLGRLAPGISPDAAIAALQPVQAALTRNDAPEDRRQAEPVMLRSALVGDFRHRLLLLLGAVSLVLLIACSNVANLLLARGVVRHRELGIRATLGAGKGRILRQLLTENLFLATFASLFGLALALFLARAFVALAPVALPGLERIGLNGPVLLFTLALAVLTTLISGLAPALFATRYLDASLRGRGPSWRRDAMRPLLVAGQVALTLTLLMASGLLIRSSIKEAAVEPGFALDQVLTAQISLPASDYADLGAVVSGFEGLLQRIAAMPEVSSVAVANRAPLAGPTLGIRYLPLDQNDKYLDGGFRIVSDSYFATAGIEQLRGRSFSDVDHATAPRTVVVNQSFARQMWGAEDPIGKDLMADNAAFVDTAGQALQLTVVGMVADSRDQGLRHGVTPEVYMSLAQAPPGPWSWLSNSLMLLVRTTAEPVSVIRPLRQAVASFDADLPLYNVSTQRQRLAASMATARFTMVLFSALGLAALLLASAGISSLTAFLVARREYELGVRMALGATRQQIFRQVTLSSMVPVLIGLLAGGLMTLASAHLLRSELFGIGVLDPITFAAALIVLGATAALACSVPARRILDIPPARALHAE